MGIEEFYLKLVGMMYDDSKFEELEAAAEAGDTKGAFEAAHALKGSLGNLALTPLVEPVSEMTERFRNAEGPVDVSDLMPAYRDALKRFRELND